MNSENQTPIHTLLYPLVDAWLLFLAGPAVAQNDFFSSDYLWVLSHLILFFNAC